ncbi:hypothetical protein P280DRAFT_219678 [Massarina eburnea CBS 473.64]|uniref:Uncharacterized protein n=1 Tax=Massarina eburnea CBS 473.64 TaxID=1395130 RepID=A0A6A6S806_9PLEO|nr:hypothetical protein P280DRAFT_219678 [Massarina eburnea CBS 473.64]
MSFAFVLQVTFAVPLLSPFDYNRQKQKSLSLLLIYIISLGPWSHARRHLRSPADSSRQTTLAYRPSITHK